MRVPVGSPYSDALLRREPCTEPRPNHVGMTFSGGTPEHLGFGKHRACSTINHSDTVWTTEYDYCRDPSHY